MKCKNPIHKHGLELPCGCCVACRINETTDWSIRALFELHDFDTASFVTLTYNKENYPKNGSLNKVFLQEFYDELQHKYKYRYGKKLRFFSCGEYGSTTGRAHYHGIIFGLNPDPFNKDNPDRKLIAESWHYCNKEMFYWNNHDYNKNAINFCTRETIQYVAGYCQKKLKSYQAEYYEKAGIEAPFKIMSKGLGLNYALENAEMLRKNKFTWYNGHKVRIPRYFREKLGIQDTPEELEEEANVMKVKFVLHEREMQEGWNRENMRFHAWLGRKGLPMDKIDDPQYRDVKERLFQHWYEMEQCSLAQQAEREFMRASKMHKGEI